MNTEQPTTTASVTPDKVRETPSNRYLVISCFAGSYNSTVHNPTGENRVLAIGDIVVFESVAPNGNVWFRDSNQERFKVESGSLENMSDRLQQLTFEEVNRRYQAASARPENVRGFVDVRPRDDNGRFKPKQIEASARPQNDAQLIAWLNKRLEKSLPLDEWQRDQLINLLCSLRAL